MKGTHLTLKDRKFIQRNLEEGVSKSQIARELGKSPSTISKEISLHRKFISRRAYYRGVGYYCKNRGIKKECYGCRQKCECYEERSCNKLKRIGICNKCPKNQDCYLDKYRYNAVKAHEEYLYSLSDSREGVNLTTSQMIAIAELIGPLLKRGQSVYQIVSNHPELNISVKSLYNYIEAGIFSDYGIDNFSLRRQVSMKKRKKLKKRKQPACYDGHKYEDYLRFKENNPTIQTTEMDTVYNDPEEPYIKTFIFENAPVMIGFLNSEKTSASMASTLDILQDRLGDDYTRLFPLILTDNGSEFKNPVCLEEALTPDHGYPRTQIFYCDPGKAYQKGAIEKNHEFIRYVIPKGKSLEPFSQDDIDKLMNHINSYTRNGNYSAIIPINEMNKTHKELVEKLGYERVDLTDINLTPNLLKK